MLELLANSYWVQIAAIVLGFVALIYGADWLVDGSSAVAKRFGISELIIGLTVVAFGTSMPEFIVSTIAAVQHNTEIAITNILGSNTINTLVILGCTALIYPIASQESCRRFDIPMSLAAGVLVLLLCWDGWMERWGGALLLLFFAAFLYHSIRLGSKGANDSNGSNGSNGSKDSNQRGQGVFKAVVLILLGLALLIVGGELVVRGATAMARQLGVGDAIIGLTIVALGTSLPELATSCIAAAKKNVDLALGNVIGSNIFNIFFILGVAAVIQPIPRYDGVLLDAAMVILSALLVLLFTRYDKQHTIQRWHGALLLLLYAAYLLYRIYAI